MDEAPEVSVVADLIFGFEQVNSGFEQVNSVTVSAKVSRTL